MIQRCTSNCQRTKSSPSVTRTISLSAWTSQRQTPRSLPVSLTNKSSSSLRVLSWYKSLCLHLRVAHPTQRCLTLLMVKTQCSMFMKENHQMQIQVWPLVATSTRTILTWLIVEHLPSSWAIQIISFSRMTWREWCICLHRNQHNNRMLAGRTSSSPRIWPNSSMRTSLEEVTCTHSPHRVEEESTPEVRAWITQIFYSSRARSHQAC